MLAKVFEFGNILMSFIGYKQDGMSSYGFLVTDEALVGLTHFNLSQSMTKMHL